eukprot:TRINITY_DN193_c0_g1_i1.p1 TRINITY_DN193_c0_g1~~TRINITY_DN193_c0_g1_i1.p1  ORF type:complete len:629 (-),score=134.33 TRINITY_DN193_c0_g1_i1:44-1930(-)
MDIVWPEGIDCIIAIDFGTFKTGYSYCHKELDSGKIHVQDNFRGDYTDYKNFTCILYRDGKPTAWGNEALDLATEELKSDYLIENFKMDLIGDENPNKLQEDSQITNQKNQRKGFEQMLMGTKTMYTSSEKIHPNNTPEIKNDLNLKKEVNHCPFSIPRSVRGKNFNVVNVIVDFLTLVKDEALQYIKKTVNYDIKKTRWIITIPAIWSEKMKDIMLWVCNKIGIGPEHCPHFTFALEPECAMVSMKKDWIDGKNVLVNDAGGGTVDFSCFKKRNGNLVQIYQPEGCPAGGTYVDQKFFDWFFEKIECGRNNIKPRHQMRDEILRSDEYLIMKKKWWIKKHIFTGEESCTIPVAKLAKKMNVKISDINQNGHLVINATQMKIFFKESIQAINDKNHQIIKDLLIKNEKIDTYILAGGYGESTYLFNSIIQYIKTNFSNQKIEIKLIPEAGKSVLKGAIFYGLNKSLISERICPSTYGVGVNELFGLKSYHTENRRITREDGNDYCIDCFHLLATVGESIKTNTFKTTTVCVDQGLNLNGASISLFSSNNKTIPHFTDTNDCSELTNITIPGNFYYNSNGILKNGANRLDIFVKLFFGAEYLKMEVEILQQIFKAEVKWPSNSGFLKKN